MITQDSERSLVLKVEANHMFFFIYIISLNRLFQNIIMITVVAIFFETKSRGEV